MTESVSLSSDASFGLYAVLESQGECESNLFNSIDCESYQVAISSSSSPDFLSSPQGLAVDAQGDNVYVVDGDNEELYKYDTSTGSVTTLMDSTYLSYPSGVAVDAQGDNVYVVDDNITQLYKYDTSTGGVTTLMDSTYLSYPTGVAVDAQGDNVYVVDGYNEELYKYDTSTGSVTTLMDSTYLSYPRGVAVDAQGDNVYVVDDNMDRVLGYDTSTDSVTFPSWQYEVYLEGPYQVAVDAHDNVYVMDQYNGNSFLRKFGISTGNWTILQQYSTTDTVGFFVCEDEIQSSFPDSSADALGACPLNGITWESSFEDACYFFDSSSDALDFWATTVASACGDALHSICNHVGDLPPYSCTRQVRQGVYDVIGTATANTELFYLLIVTILARLLSRFKTGNPASTGAASSDSAASSAAEGGVELGGVNPLRDELPGAETTSDGDLIRKLTNDLAKLTNEVAELRRRAGGERVPAASQRRSSV